MKQPLYRVVLATAWEITLKHKFLWVLGIFASLIMARIFPPIINNYYYLQEKFLILKKLSIFDPETIKTAFSWTNYQQLSAQSISTYLIIAGTVVIFLFAIWLVITAQIALITAGAQYYRGKKKLNFMKLLDDSKKYFWPILINNLAFKLAIFGFFMLLSLPIFYFYLQNNQIGEIVSAIIFFILFTIIELLAGFMLIYSNSFIILDKTDIWQAVKDAFHLFHKKWLISIETAVVLFALQIFALAVSIVLTTIIALPFLIIFYISLLANFLALAVLAITLAIVLGFAAILFFNGFFTSFYIMSWTVLFIKLTQESPIAKLIRIEMHIRNYLKRRKK
jgi:hypothetical protein